MPPLRIMFFGTAELARTCLVALVQSPLFEVIGVTTQPDRPRGRDLKLQPTPVKAEAERRQLAVWQPLRAREQTFGTALAELKPDLIVVAAYGQILPPSILDLPRFGCLNVHASLLPKYRGAAPIQWAILNDESETGVTIMKMDAGLDTGDILTQEKTGIVPDDNAQTLQDRLACLGAELLVKTIPDYVGGKIAPRKQPQEQASHAPKISKEEGRLDWSQPARTLWNRVRAFTPWPGAYTGYGGQLNPRRLKIWRVEVTAEAGGKPGEIIQADRSCLLVAAGQQSLRILDLQREGGRRLSAAEFLSGAGLQKGGLLE
ncbi:MAG: methionyl-tRNA formyltransferase [Verrucomicrobiota bacterium]